MAPQRGAIADCFSTHASRER